MPASGLQRQGCSQDQACCDRTLSQGAYCDARASPVLMKLAARKKAETTSQTVAFAKPLSASTIVSVRVATRPRCRRPQPRPSAAASDHTDDRGDEDGQQPPRARVDCVGTWSGPMTMPTQQTSASPPQPNRGLARRSDWRVDDITIPTTTCRVRVKTSAKPRQLGHRGTETQKHPSFCRIVRLKPDTAHRKSPCLRACSAFCAPTQFAPLPCVVEAGRMCLVAAYPRGLGPRPNIAKTADGL